MPVGPVILRRPARPSVEVGVVRNRPSRHSLASHTVAKRLGARDGPGVSGSGALSESVERVGKVSRVDRIVCAVRLVVSDLDRASSKGEEVPRVVAEGVAWGQSRRVLPTHQRSNRSSRRTRRLGSRSNLAGFPAPFEGLGHWRRLQR